MACALILLIAIVHDGQRLLQVLAVLCILDDLVHLQEVCFLALGNAFDPNSQLLGTILLLIAAVSPWP